MQKPEFKNPCKRALELVYDRYGKIIYGMIKFSVTDTESAQAILQNVFSSLDKHDIAAMQNQHSARLLQLTRKCIHEYLQKNKEADSLLVKQRELDNNTILQLAFFGKYDLSQLSSLLGTNEETLKRRLQAAVRMFVNNRPAEAGTYKPVDFIPQRV